MPPPAFGAADRCPCSKVPCWRQGAPRRSSCSACPFVGVKDPGSSGQGREPPICGWLHRWPPKGGPTSIRVKEVDSSFGWARDSKNSASRLGGDFRKFSPALPWPGGPPRHQRSDQTGGQERKLHQQGNRAVPSLGTGGKRERKSEGRDRHAQALASDAIGRGRVDGGDSCLELTLGFVQLGEKLTFQRRQGDGLKRFSSRLSSTFRRCRSRRRF